MHRDERGATMAEYCILVGVVALLAIGAFRLFGSSMRGTVASQSVGLASVESGETSLHDDVHEARGGSGSRGAANAAIVGAAKVHGAGPNGSDSKGGATYAIVFAVAAIVLSYGVIKLRRASA